MIIVAMTVAALNAHAHAETAAQALPPKTPAPSVAKNQAEAKVASHSGDNMQKTAGNAGGNRETVTLQMGAFTDPNLAYKQAAKASLLGLPSRVVHMKNRNGDTVRVVRSSYRLKQVEAEKIAADLREQQVNVLLMQ